MSHPSHMSHSSYLSYNLRFWWRLVLIDQFLHAGSGVVVTVLVIGLEVLQVLLPHTLERGVALGKRNRVRVSVNGVVHQALGVLQLRVFGGTGGQGLIVLRGGLILIIYDAGQHDVIERIGGGGVRGPHINWSPPPAWAPR